MTFLTRLFLLFLFVPFQRLFKEASNGFSSGGYTVPKAVILYPLKEFFIYGKEYLGLFGWHGQNINDKKYIIKNKYIDYRKYNVYDIYNLYA